MTGCSEHHISEKTEILKNRRILRSEVKSVSGQTKVCYRLEVLAINFDSVGASAGDGNRRGPQRRGPGQGRLGPPAPSKCSRSQARQRAARPRRASTRRCRCAKGWKTGAVCWATSGHQGPARAAALSRKGPLHWTPACGLSSSSRILCPVLSQKEKSPNGRKCQKSDPVPRCSRRRARHQRLATFHKVAASSPPACQPRDREL